MTGAPGAANRAGSPIPVTGTLKEAYALVRRHPRTVLLPLAMVTVPAAAVAGGIYALLFLTIWGDEELRTFADINTSDSRSILFAVVALAASEMLFTQVARGATIVAIAGVLGGKPPSVAEALDPAFTRLGGLLALVLLTAALFGVALVTVIGLAVLPYLVLRLGLAFDVLMIEGRNPAAAVSRSWRLMRGNVLRLLALILLAALAAVPIVVLASLPGGIEGGSRTMNLALVVGYSVFQSAAMVPVIGFLTACTTLYYFKARARFDATGSA